jgi:hypothetical protein
MNVSTCGWERASETKPVTRQRADDSRGWTSTAKISTQVGVGAEGDAGAERHLGDEDVPGEPEIDGSVHVHAAAAQPLDVAQRKFKQVVALVQPSGRAPLSEPPRRWRAPNRR